ALETRPDQTVRTPDVLPGPERVQLLETWNATAAPSGADVCLHELVEAQTARTPDAIALVAEGSAVSYAVLNARANQLAHHLRARGAGPDARVAICLERSVDLIVALL